MVRKGKMAISKRLAVAVIGLIFLTGCSGAKIRTEKQVIVDGEITAVSFSETSPQIEYQNTVRKMMIAMTSAKPTLELSFKAVKISNIETVIVPEIKQYQAVDWNAALALIQRTPTTGENWKNGLIEGLKNLGIPLAIAGMATVAVQVSRSSEEHQATQTAGGDIVESGDGSDRSTEVTEIIEDSFNEEEIEKSYNSGNVQ
jgi:hypothetical protein